MIIYKFMVLFYELTLKKLDYKLVYGLFVNDNLLFYVYFSLKRG